LQTLIYWITRRDGERLPVCERFNFQFLPIRAYDHIITISVIRRAPALCFIILICAIR